MSASKYKSYPNYTESNFEFIPKYPSHWELKRMQWIGKFSASGIDKNIVESESDCFMVNYTDVYGNETAEIHSNQEFMKTTTTSQKIGEHQLQKGDMLFTPSSETVEDIGVSAVAIEDMPEIVYSYHLTRFRPSTHLGVNFSRFFCNSTQVLSQLSKVARGTTRQILSRSDFNNLLIPFPPIEERTIIGNFLLNKIKDINMTLFDLEKILSSVEPTISSLISKVVNEGINIDVEMKHSGIEWIGKIPQHWGITKIRHVSDLSQKRNNDGVVRKMLSVSQYYGIIEKEFSDDSQMPNQHECSHYLVVENFDLVVNTMWLHHRGIAVSFGVNGYVSPDYKVYKLDLSQISPGYMHHLLRSKRYLDLYSGNLRGIRPNSSRVGTHDFVRFDIPLPPMKEQERIADYLDMKISKFMHLKECIKLQIEKLREYRKSLISATSAGIIDVRSL